MNTRKSTYAWNKAGRVSDRGRLRGETKEKECTEEEAIHATTTIQRDECIMMMFQYTREDWKLEHQPVPRVTTIATIFVGTTTNVRVDRPGYKK